MYTDSATILTSEEFKEIILTKFNDSNAQNLDEFCNQKAKEVGFENFKSLMNYGNVYVSEEDDLFPYMGDFKFPISLHQKDGNLYIEVTILDNHDVSVYFSDDRYGDNKFLLESHHGYFIEHDEWTKFQDTLENDIESLITSNEYKDANDEIKHALIQDVIENHWLDVDNQTFDELYLEPVCDKNIVPDMTMTEWDYRKFVIEHYGHTPPWAAYDALKDIHEIEVI